MVNPKDILFDDNGEELFKDGDHVIGDATMHYSKLLIMCEKGENKKHPDSGVGVNSWLLDEAGGDDLKKEITAQLEGDGQVIETLTGDNLNNLVVSGKYVR